MPPVHLQTSKEAKASYKKTNNGTPRLNERQRKQLARDLVLQDRADKERERESRRQWAIKQKAKREEQERSLRQQQGIGLATQLAGYSHTQKRMKSAMEGFLRNGPVSKIREGAATDSETERSENEPDKFDIDDEILDAELENVEMTLGAVQKSEPTFTAHEQADRCPQKRSSFKATQSFSESLDDDSLIEAEILITAPTRTEQSSTQAKTRKRSFAIMAEADSAACTPVTAVLAPASETVNNTLHCKSRSISKSDDKDRVQDVQEDVLDALFADTLPSNTQIANEITSPTIVSSRSLLHQVGSNKAARRARRSQGHESNADKRDSVIASTRDSLTKSTKLKDGQAMPTMPPPPPRIAQPQMLPRKSPKRPVDQRMSAFSDFGLSTQLVHAVIDVDLDFSDDDAKRPGPVQDVNASHDIGGSFDYSDSDLDLDAEFG